MATKPKDHQLTWLDRSTSFVIVRCNACQYWHGFGLDDVEGWTVAWRHELRTHPGAGHAGRRLRDAERRAAHSS